MLLPVIVAKIIPFDGNSTVPQADRDAVGNGYREKLDPSIKNKCVQSLWNDRGSIYTMSFKLNSNQDLETLKNMEKIYKEESHVHQFNIPFETAVWNEANLPIRGTQSTAPAVNTPSNPQQSNSSSSEMNTQQNTEQQNQAPLPQRKVQTQDGSLQS